MNSDTITKHLKKFAANIIAKYEDVQNFDKIYQAQINIEQTQLTMEDNMKKMLINQVNIQVKSFFYIRKHYIVSIQQRD